MTLLLPATAAAAQSPSSPPLTEADVFNIEYATSPQIAPDGRRVAYVRHGTDIMADRRISNLWIVNADGTNNHPVTTGKQSDDQPRWSPDGTRIAYVSDRDGTGQLYVVWVETGYTVKVTNLAYPPNGIAWSPDGKQLAFTALVADKPPQIATLPAPPEGAKWAAPAVVIDKLIYRYDGAGYLKTGFVHLFTVSAEGGVPRQVSSGAFQHGGVFDASAPVWAPDGKSIVLSANRRADYELEPLDTEIHEFSLGDASVRQLTSRKGPDGSPAISPDGRFIAYVGFDDRYQGYQINRLYVMDRDGRNSRPLAVSLDRSPDQPSWAPDGSGILFVYDDQGDSKLGLATLDGKVRTLTGRLGGGGSAYGGASYSVARTGAFAIGYSSAGVPGEVAVGTMVNPTPRVVTDVNSDLLAARRLGTVEEIWYPSSRDQRRIHGWIIKPPGFDPSRKYPLILEIHGGPFANYGPRFDFEKQVYAGKGYVVLYTNPRGSTSYGEEFGNLIHHAYPGDDFFDLNSGVDAVVAKGYIDPSQLFVTGGSGGGVLTSWVIGRTTRFRAAATVYPVINWTSWLLTSDVPSFGAKYWFPGLPWDNAEHYEKRSLLSVVKNVKTPTMVITGEEDYRTPMSESEQYYAALKLLGVESVLVRVPGEPHGIRRIPSHHMAKMANIAGWFDRHRGSTP